MAVRANLIPPERIERSILLIRGCKVMLDAELAQLYGVPTKVLNQAVKRNKERFPDDFMFQLTAREFAILKSQFVTSSQWGGRRISPYVFTEQGVAMLSSVLRSRRAVQVNIEIMRAFVRLREMVASHKDLAHRLDELEKGYDAQFKVVFDALRELMNSPTQKRRQIGFIVSEKAAKYRGKLPSTMNPAHHQPAHAECVGLEWSEAFERLEGLDWRRCVRRG